MFLFDPFYLIVISPGIILSLWASWKVKSNFRKYSAIRSVRGITGAQAAAELLRAGGVQDVSIESHEGFMTDHYNPLSKTLSLSNEVFTSTSVAAIGVASHEAGHALQHAENYKPLWLRSTLVPTANIGSKLGYGAMLLGLFIHPSLVLVGAVLFSAVLLFQLVTLPVEFNATNRAKALVLEQEIIHPREREGVDRVLNAAALTYVAAVVSTLMTLIYFLMRAGFLGGSDD
ncbi:MAG: zinc metallopeptidase [Acidobacteriia bacterium]|jgi:Zn-dependent membrane protease YugP|nr:zinc metallopeptidase [Terriglobia bacterium]